MNSCLEHSCLVVNDAAWHLKLFKELLNAEVLRQKDMPDGSVSYWLSGGYQLVQAAAPFAPAPLANTACAHLGVAVDGDCVQLGERALALGCRPVPGKKHNWIALPDGGVLELMQAQNPAAIDAYRALRPDTTFPR